MNDLVYILVLAIVVTVHEFGHYTMARMMGVKVKRMQIFFSTVYAFKPQAAKRSHAGTSWRDTEYAVGWIPFGGYTSYENRPLSVIFTDAYGQKHSIDYDTYLKLHGKSAGSHKQKDFYYNTKSAWKRFLISIAGVLFNLITALIIYTLIIFMSNVGNGTGFWQELSAAGEFIVFAVGNTFANIFAMLGLQINPPSISAENYELIAAFADTASNYAFLIHLADLSCVLALINILPIPPLDGGQATFEIYEMITGKAPSNSFKKVASIIGCIIFILVFWILPMLR